MIGTFKSYFHLLKAISANVVYGFPSKRLKVIGVSGTDGKTTSVNLIYHILKNAGFKTAMVSTVGAAIGDRIYDVGFHVTTPSPFALQKYIKEAIKKENVYLILEITSHGLDQNRAWGIDFEIGVITNITHEHLDYHKTYENYVDAKCKLIKRSKIGIVNRDDESYKILNFKFKILNKKIITYGRDNKADINQKVFPFKTNLVGEFNIYNSLAAIAVCRQLGVEDNKIREGLLSFQAPVGRQEIVYNKDFSIMVDFAHTPNSFQQLLPGLKRQTKGRLIHVFGCAGKRDSSKRPIMGKISSSFADIVILTAEDPRREPIEKINSEIAKGFVNGIKLTDSKHYSNWKDKKLFFEIADRQEAISYAVSIAEKGDTIVLTGKSHEKSMNLGRGEEAWDEFEAVKKALKKKKIIVAQLNN